MTTKNIFIFSIIYLLSMLFSNIKAQNYDNDTIPPYVCTYKIKKGNTISLNTTGYIYEDAFLEYYGFRYGKFFVHNFLTGAEIGRSFYGYYERGTNFGIFERYYFAAFNRFSYFTDAKYLFGFRNYHNPQTLSEWQGTSSNFAINIGISCIGCYKRRFNLDFFTGYAFNYISIKNHPTLGAYKYSKHEILYGFQLNFHF